MIVGTSNRRDSTSIAGGTPQVWELVPRVVGGAPRV